jgi:hypothetical protein
MSELVTKSVPQEQQERKVETRTAVERVAGFTFLAIATAVLTVLVASALFAQSEEKEKYSLKSPSGIAFSNFRRWHAYQPSPCAHVHCTAFVARRFAIRNYDFLFRSSSL